MLTAVLPSTPEVLALGPSFLTPARLLSAGLVVVLLIVFAETGLLIGFFLPGDSLLFTAGFLARTNADAAPPLWAILVLVPVAAIIGDQVGYLIGQRAGPRVFDRPDSRLFKRAYVDRAYGYFERYGARTIVIARFVPVVRTFTPVVAGVSKMHYRTFVTYNAIGGIFWGVLVVLLGYALGGVAFVANHLELIILFVVVLSVIPIALELLRGRKGAKGR